MTDEEIEYRENLLDYVRFARRCADGVLTEPDRLERWTREELAEISAAADTFADAYTIVSRKRNDREILQTMAGVNSAHGHAV